MTRANLRVMFLAATAVALAGCAVNPATGKREFSLVSQDQELKIGRDGHEAIVAEYGIYDDQEIQAHVQDVGMKLAKASPLPDLEWHFTVLDDPVVNAFALPGGYIYITRGILAHLNSDAQLAGVLGHEIGHVTARHTAARITQQQLAGLGLAAGMIFSSTLRRYGADAQTGLGLLFLKFGRDDENQSDELGISYSTAAGYDPREIPSTYAMLKRVGGQTGERLPGFLSTHPDPGDREERTTRLANAAAAGRTDLTIERSGYVARLADLVYGPDPRIGYFDGSDYYHPNLNLHIQLPEGWEYQDQKTALVAVVPDKQAGMEITIPASGAESPQSYVNTLLQNGRIQDASGRTETIGAREAWLGHVTVQKSDGTPLTLFAAFVHWRPEAMLQILGNSARPGDAFEKAITRSVRSLREITDPAKRAVQPDRVKIERVTSPMTFGEVVGSVGGQALDFENTAILNNRRAGEELAAGELVKIVVPGKKP